MSDRSSPPHAHRTTLAAAPAVAVEACGCGTIHVTIGAITLRLPREAFDEVVGVLALARSLTPY